ncbi:MAG: LytR/AlgR family response regulator transcription factor [Gammaproteobacteria bacterium]
MNASSHVLQMMPDFIAKNELMNLIGKLPVKVGTHIRFINLMNILYIQACGNYVDIATVSGEILHTKEQIADIENRLPMSLFVRVHRSFIISKEHVKEIRSKQNDYEFTLVNDVTITSGSTYKKDIRKQFLLSPDSERK